MTYTSVKELATKPAGYEDGILICLASTYTSPKRGRYIHGGIPEVTLDLQKCTVKNVNTFKEIADQMYPTEYPIGCADLSQLIISGNKIAQKTRRAAGNLLVMNAKSRDFISDWLEGYMGKFEVLIDESLEDYTICVGLEGGQYDRSIIWNTDGSLMYGIGRLENNWIKIQYS